MRGRHAGFQRLLLGRLSPGVWSVASLEPGAAEVADRHGWRVFRLSFDETSDRLQILGRLASSMELSDRSERPWDAIHDLLIDRPWPLGSRVLLLVDGAGDASTHLAALREILDGVARVWASRGVGFFVVWVGATCEPRLDYWLGLDDPDHPPVT